MQCPDCGYEADDAAVFCPQCRFQFRGPDNAPHVPDTAVPDTPAQPTVFDESIFEETQKGFSEKELRLLGVQLIQPTVLIVLIISLFTYSLVWTIPFIPITIFGLSFGVTGIVCLACGILTGLVFFFITRRSLMKFRYRDLPGPKQ